MSWITKQTLSNFKKATNLVFRLNRMLEIKMIVHWFEVFLFTNNKVVECMHFRGSSKSPLLHNKIE